MTIDIIDFISHFITAIIAIAAYIFINWLLEDKKNKKQDGKIKHVYHICCKFINQGKYAYWDSVLTAEEKIDFNNYEGIKQQIYDKAGDKFHKNFEKIHMSIISLSYLHAEE